MGFDSLGIERGGLHAFRHTKITLNAYAHVVSEDDVRLVAQLDEILQPIAPEKENGSGLEHPKPLFLN